jgi:hypothetical protein
VEERISQDVGVRVANNNEEVGKLEEAVFQMDGETSESAEVIQNDTENFEDIKEEVSSFDRSKQMALEADGILQIEDGDTMKEVGNENVSEEVKDHMEVVISEDVSVFQELIEDCKKREGDSTFFAEEFRVRTFPEYLDITYLSWKTIQIGKCEVRALCDISSVFSLVNWDCLEGLGFKSQNLYPADLQAHGFGRCDKIIGQISLDIMIDKRPYSQTFLVLKTDSMYRYKILLGYDFVCKNRIAVCPPDPTSGIAESVLRTPDDVKTCCPEEASD